MLMLPGVILCVLLVIAAALWLNRRAATRQALIGWLEQQGIEADMQVERVELDGLVASIRIGDPRDPDVIVDRVEVDYALGAPWSKGGLGVTPSRVRLVRPVVRASFRNGKLSLGSLDPLIEKFTGRPPKPDSRSPVVIVERGRLRLDTDYGPTTVLADAHLDNGKLLRLSARMPETALKSGEIEGRDVAAALDLTTTGDRVAVQGWIGAASGRLPGLTGENARLTFGGNLPYPDLKTRRGDGLVRLDGRLTAGRLNAADAGARDLDTHLVFDGRTSGWIETFRIEGVSDLTAGADTITGPAVGRNLAFSVTRAQTVLARGEDGLSWSADGGVRMTAAALSGAGLEGNGVAVSSSRLALGGRDAAVEAQGAVALTARGLNWDQMKLQDVRGQASLDVVADGGVRVQSRGGLRAARGSWPLFGPRAADDIPELAEMKAALSNFAVEVPAFDLTAGDSGTRLTLARPATLRPANGGVLTLNPAGTPLFSAGRGEAGGGALTLTATRGRGLPEAAFAIPRWGLTPSGFEATLDGRAALDFGLARGLTVQTKGQLASSNGRLTYVASGCAPVTVERLELDENDVVEVSGQLCPVDRPLTSVADGGWRSDGSLTGFNAKVPFLALAFEAAEGGFTAIGGPRGIGLDARVAKATVVDATTPRRFNPITASGSATLANENWTGAFDLARNEAPLGRLTLAHDGRSGAGGMVIDAPSITFAEPGLQPDDLSPLAGQYAQSPVTGSVGFTGRIDWIANGEGSSGGRLTIPGLDFTSPAGAVKGLRGTVDFTSLAPLVTAPDQRLTIDRLETFTALTDVELVFGLDKASLEVDGGTVKVGGGTISVEPLSLPLDPNQPFSGVIVVDRVQLGDAVAGAGFGDKVLLDAVVSGRLPFTYDRTNGIRIQAGTLGAVQPGRLSIKREALSGLEAGGGGEDAGVPPNTVQDLAYQAMENLAFEILSADVNSLDAGRMNLLFHIKGRHDPPRYQELRVPVDELISREFLDKPVTLPSNTQIDLTLDTNLNVNQLISDLLAINRARDGEPGSPTPTP